MSENHHVKTIKQLSEFESEIKAGQGQLPMDKPYLYNPDAYREVAKMIVSASSIWDAINCFRAKYKASKNANHVNTNTGLIKSRVYRELSHGDIPIGQSVVLLDTLYFSTANPTIHTDALGLVDEDRLLDYFYFSVKHIEENLYDFTVDVAGIYAGEDPSSFNSAKP